MLRSIVISVLFLWVCCQSQDAENLESCSAYGDPHVIKFPSTQGERVPEVWCKVSGDVSLIKNDYIDFDVVVGPQPYVITGFNLVFYNDAHKLTCVINEKQFLLEPGACGKDVTISKNGDLLTIVNKKHDITVTIKRFNWNKDDSPYGYDITVLQPAYLIPSSTGLCTRSCDPNTGLLLERQRRADANKNLVQQSAEKICEIVISKVVPEFKVTSLNRMNIETKNAFSACKTDVQLTGDIIFAKTNAANLVIRLATKNLPSKSNTQQILNKAYERSKEIEALLDSALTEFLKQTPSKDDLSLVVKENESASISCRRTYSGVIKIISASLESRSPSCSVNVTSRVKELCASSPRLCQFKASNTELQNNSCSNGDKQLKIVYQCVGPRPIV